MGKERKCILCEMVCSSKQEMDDHMRSMLHHRELEKLKGRDCGHECKVCQVTVVSLTDYAGHISSSLHKQNVEASERQNARNDRDVEYFDQTLVDLIEKRKESIRKQEEEAAAQRAREEAEKRRQQDFQQRLAEAKERFRLSIAQKHPWALRSPKASGGAPCRPGAWNGNSPSGGGTGDHGAWVQGRQGKSATWHAQQAPNFRSCEAGGWGPGGSLGSAKGWGGNHWDKGPFPGNQWDKGPFPGNQWDKGPFPGNKRGRHPWLSNRGSSNGVYGRNNIPQYPQLSRPVGLGPLPSHQAPPNPSPRALGQTPNQFRLDRRFGGGLGEGHHNGAGPGECNPGNNVSPKTFGSNPKLDKVCRWSPYPPTKLLDPVPQKEPHPGSSEKLPQAAVCPQQQRAPDGSGILDRCSQVEGEARHWRQGGDGVDGKKRQQANKKKGEASGSGSREATSSPGPSKHKADRKLENSNRKWSLTPPNKTKPRRNSTEEQKRPKSGPKATGRTLPVEPLQSRQEQQLSVTLDKSREAVLERRGSADQEAALPVVEEPQRSCPESQAGADKENKCSQAAAKMEVMDSLPDSTQYLQSVQVSTSTKDVAGSALSGPREDEKAHGGQAEEDGGRAEWRGSLDVSDEATRAGEARHSSESDASRGASEVQNPSAVGVPGLTQLGLPPVLKRDLTKHISCKSKTAGREPNLNIARRVRNVSESRKGDSEKESGLKPTVRQLLSSTGSRRNVNWEQVYEEVRKKQGQGKGLPRFGIEMVSCDQEEHSQEDEDMTLLEGFHWDSLMGSPITPRKRSLSESSVAPTRLGSCHDLFARQTSGDSLPQADVPSSDEQDDCKPAVAPRLSPPSSQGTGGGPQQPDEERGPRDSEAGAQGPAGGAKKGRVRVLQRSDSALGDCSSGTELYDAQGMGKKRRAAGDIPIPDISSLQRKNKRMKMKSKKERFQVDQLLAVSLREEQLSLSLQTLDTNLIQAKSALQTAYMEVQHIMLLKQQVATEMSALRNQRIELLKGMQGFEDTPASPTVKEEMRDLEVEASNAASSLPYPCTPCPTSHPAPRPASPPSCGPPRPPVGVKQEPMSPVHVSADLDPEPMESLVPVAPTSPPEPSVPPLSTSPLDTTPRCSPEQGLCPDQAELSSGLFKDGSLSATAMMDRAVQADQESLGSPLDSKLHLEHFPSGRRSPESGRRGEVAVPPQSGEHPAVSQAPPLSPSALRGRGKRVRRLRKRRSMNKTQGGDDEPGSSNTEADEEASRPRRLRPRRRSSGGSSQVSTSTPPAAPEEDEDEASGVPGESCECAEVVTETLEVAGPGEEDLDSALEMVVLPSETVNIDTSEPEENMEVGQACQQPVMEFGSPGSSSAPDATWRPLQNLASNEVTSTSDMDVYGAVKPYQSDTQMPLASAQMPLASAQLTKVSSDTSSDPGGEELPTEGAFQGHQEAVNGMQIHGGLLYTCSGDRSVRAFNLANHTCVAVFEGHSSKVNCLLVSAAPGVPQRLYSGSSDQTICCYNLQTRLLEQQYSLPDRVLCLHSRWKVLYAGLANGTVVTFNLKTNRQLEVFDCHGPRAVSCLASAQEGALKLLLVGSFDSTISVRDARNGLLLRTLEGHTKTVLCMKVVNDLVFSGSCDQSVHAHNIHTGELVRIYKGHRHAVTVVAILGKVMVTASLDKLVRVYELQSHARLQVYGGHKDMVMCMVVHKSMIYTGCYDGSVQAVKLNLMQNHRCVWSGCSLIFGVQEHLQQHLMDEHANPSQSFQTLRCRWKNCNEVFCAQTRSQQGMFTHMQKHLEETS